MSHLYKIGQLLELRSAPRLSNRPAGTCEVVACLPHDKGPVLYRVQSINERNERVVEETDLVPSTAAKSAEEAVENERSSISIAVSRRR
ncbi:hypothetical protein [Devosia rhizoryzae]|uniref:Hypervirulence associated protein TUDOR domain-containing protein n=1 Tax=Devosia rhizoryzae TaxID=2774137 RepID=A0ABX7C5J6_9HYPH|nr:hypothetical protein [Devosia rhizoryzae]QQR39510.1 hypothetical protein JI748_00360 [Devosia rhizoryzae]